MKKEIRKKIKEIREKLTNEEILHNSAHIVSKLLMLPQILKCSKIALYAAVKGEVNLDVMLEILQKQGKECYLPVVRSNQELTFARYKKGDITKLNQYGIVEPMEHNIIANIDLDVVILPVVAFNLTGDRIGSGAGFYDRTFYFKKTEKKNKPYLIGVAFDFQQEDFVRDPWDALLDVIVTETRTILMN